VLGRRATTRPAPSALTRRSALGLLGLAGVAATGLAWPRLTAQDIPGRGTDALVVTVVGTAQDAAARQVLVDRFQQIHPEIPVRIQAVQAIDQGDYLAKVLTMIAAGNPPDVLNVATEGTQLFASRLAEPLDAYVLRDAAELQEYFDDVHPALLEAFSSPAGGRSATSSARRASGSWRRRNARTPRGSG
jgi:multiple sugar transport system substrate-binding protein